MSPANANLPDAEFIELKILNQKFTAGDITEEQNRRRLALSIVYIMSPEYLEDLDATHACFHG